MAKLKFCPNCCQNVTIQHKWGWFALIFLLLCGIFPGIIYYLVLHGDVCPMCKTDADELAPPKRTFEG